MSSDDIYDRPRGPWEKIRTALVGVLVGMLVLAFAVWGIEDVFSPNRTNAIVKVGDAEVGRTEFMDRFNNQMREFAEQNGEGLTPQQALDRGIPQQLIGQFAQELAIEVDADDLGIGVNNRDVQSFVQSLPAFQNEVTQQFDEQQMRNILASNRITMGQFEQDVVNTLTQRQTLPAIMGGINAPSEYARRFNTYVNEIRSARVLDFGIAALDPIPAPTDAQLESYIAANQGRFTAPEYRQFLMLRIEPFDFRQDVEVTDDQLRARFDTLIGAGEIGADETRDVSIISVPSREQADMAAARISSGDPIETVVADLQLQTPARFDAIKPDALLNPASSDVAFETDAGTARVAETDFGTFEVVAVRAINAAEIPDFDAMRDELTEDVIEGQARRQISEYERTIDDALLEGRTVEEIAEELELPLSSYPFIDRTGRTQDGTYMGGFTLIPGIGTDDRLLQAVFTSDIGFESDIIATSNNGLAVLRVTDIIDSRPQTLDEAREEAVTLWTAQQAADALTQKGVSIVQRVRGGEALEDIATELGAELRQVAIQRAAPPRDVSPAVLVGLLDGEVGEVARGSGVDPDTYQVAVLDDVSAGGDRIGGQMLGVIQNTVSEQLALDVSEAYQNAIIAEKDQIVFEDQMRAALGIQDDG
ncbi:MAG: SurA N-terminal domain-containing protein [Litorimonas sp.]